MNVEIYTFYSQRSITITRNAYFYCTQYTQKALSMHPKHFIILMVLIACSAGLRAGAQTTKDSLAIFRTQIDSLDKQLIEILGKRMQVVDAVGKYKAAHNIPALQQSRFDAILQKNIALGKTYNLSATLVTDIMNAIHKESLGKEAAVGAPAATH